LIGWSAIFTWPVLVAQLIIFGTATFALIFAPRTMLETAVPAHQTVKLWRGFAILNLAISLLLFLEMASEMAQLTWTQTLPFLQEITGETLAGRVWIWRLRLVVILAIAVWMPLRKKAIALAALITSAALLVLGSITTHAIDHGALAVTIYFVHQAAAGLWLGALASLLVGARGGADAFRALAPCVSSACASSVVIIALSGVLTSFQSIGWNLHLLIDSSYGRTLVAKLMTAAPALLLGGYNRYWQMPKLSEESVRALLLRNVAGECLLLVAVLAWTAMLANTPPPH
jgi:putative copper export protein